MTAPALTVEQLSDIRHMLENGVPLTALPIQKARALCDLAIAALSNRTVSEQNAPAKATAKQQYEQFTVDGEDSDPIERLRFFCSLAMKGQDWLDVEPFFDALSPPAEARELADSIEREIQGCKWCAKYPDNLHSLSMTHDCWMQLVAAIRGGRIDALLSGKERTK